MHLHEKEAIADPNILDRIFKEMHEAYEQRKVPLTHQQGLQTTQILFGTKVQADEAWDDLRKSHYQFAGFFKRCEMFPIKYDKQLQLWLTIITVNFGIGGMILVAYYVQWWAANNAAIEVLSQHRALGLEDVMYNCFPFGVFDIQTVHEFWDKQKVRASPTT